MEWVGNLEREMPPFPTIVLDNYIFPSPLPANVVNNFNSFANAKSLLHSYDQPNLIVMEYLFNALLNSISFTISMPMNEGCL